MISRAMRVLLLVLSAVLLVGAQEAGIPEREIVVAFEYPRMEVEPSESLSLSLILKNNGEKDETLVLEISESPDGLQSRIEDFGKVIGGIFVASHERKTLKLSARRQVEESETNSESEGEKTIAAGDYKFAVKAATEDGTLVRKASARVTVRSTESEEGERAGDPIEISCSYPTLRGANDGDFKFSINVHNHTGVEDIASLRAEAPKGWDVIFKPSYENKYIGSLKVDANGSKSVDVEVNPPPGSTVGKYPIVVYSKLSKRELEADQPLEVELTGTYRIKCRTLNDVLSLTAKGGGESTISMYVINQGTAAQKDLSFDSFKPENWKVEFKPERIDSIEPGEMEQVEILITPDGDALVGDYSVSITTRGEKAQDDMELRVTVKPSTLWAWIGVITIIVVIVVLSILFKVLGRR